MGGKKWGEEGVTVTGPTKYKMACDNCLVEIPFGITLLSRNFVLFCIILQGVTGEGVPV